MQPVRAAAAAAREGLAAAVGTMPMSIEAVLGPVRPCQCSAAGQQWTRTCIVHMGSVSLWGISM